MSWRFDFKKFKLSYLYSQSSELLLEAEAFAPSSRASFYFPGRKLVLKQPYISLLDRSYFA